MEHVYISSLSLRSMGQYPLSCTFTEVKYYKQEFNRDWNINTKENKGRISFMLIRTLLQDVH